MRAKFAVACAVSALALAATVRADTVSYTLGLGNVGGISGYTGPYADVLVNRTSSTSATITFTSITGVSGHKDFYLVDGGSVGVNVAGAFSGSSTATGSGPNSASLSATNAGSSSEDGWGNFNLTYNLPNASPSNWAKTLSFTVTATGVNSWGTAGSVLTLNDGATGYLAAAHIAVADPGVTSVALTTGYAANGVVVPLPAAAWMGMSLMGTIGGAGWLRKRRQSIA